MRCLRQPVLAELLEALALEQLLCILGVLGIGLGFRVLGVIVLSTELLANY